jgi:hypothetical protein
VQQAHKEDRITFTALTPWPGELVCAEGRYLSAEGGVRSAESSKSGIDNVGARSRVAQPSPAASSGGVSPRGESPGETPGELAGGTPIRVKRRTGAPGDFFWPVITPFEK